MIKVGTHKNSEGVEFHKMLMIAEIHSLIRPRYSPDVAKRIFEGSSLRRISGGNFLSATEKTSCSSMPSQRNPPSPEEI
jgi:hypothetical protein